MFKLEALCGLLANKTLFKIRELAAYDCNLCGERTLINYPFRHNASNLTFLIARKAKKTRMINCYILLLMVIRINSNVCTFTKRMTAKSAIIDTRGGECIVSSVKIA